MISAPFLKTEIPNSTKHGTKFDPAVTSKENQLVTVTCKKSFVSHLMRFCRSCLLELFLLMGSDMVDWTAPGLRSWFWLCCSPLSWIRPHFWFWRSLLQLLSCSSSSDSVAHVGFSLSLSLSLSLPQFSAALSTLHVVFIEAF